MLAIGTLAKRTGTKVQTIRYYEQIGLLPEPGRTEGGQRRYGRQRRHGHRNVHACGALDSGDHDVCRLRRT